ncbi:MAG: bifunctional 5,10-methylenetetrahydrofolate dehydrogenase/5,10-methenyltetrahydrofolate cyclohydrolase, partial [Acidobacteria bacterium]|nr:bifunctional 5,10-methylenetetrahydrofolate dehydrogenase/5,10-methenyltetrahydrofolate cyclohydrolase [Acidobacteriota bacterium]
MKSEQRRAATLDGARIAEEIKRETAGDAARLKREYGITPGLVVMRVGDDPASEVYVRSKVKTSEELGLLSEHRALPASTSEADLVTEIEALNAREEVDGILVQLPLPRHIDEGRVIEAIDPAKDVDGFHALNVGLLALGRPAFVPCTPAGIVEMLEREGVEIRGAHACVVGRSQIVGRPLAQLLLQRDATVTVCHSRTPDLAAHTSRADILAAAVGRAGLIRGGHVKPGATVIDVG